LGWYRLFQTDSQLNGLKPQAYIADAMAKIAGNWPAARWDEFMPWNWQPDLRSPAHTYYLPVVAGIGYATQTSQLGIYGHLLRSCQPTRIWLN
jgi:hypothetical protein